jgi:hypothetical protein
MSKLVIMKMAPIEFTDWFNRLLFDRGWGVREASRKIGISHPVVSNLQKGEQPTEGVCVKIAISTNFPTDYILSIAGYKDDYREDAMVDLIHHLASQLTAEEDKNEAVEYLRLRLRIAEGRGKHEVNHEEKRSPKIE